MEIMMEIKTHHLNALKDVIEFAWDMRNFLPPDKVDSFQKKVWKASALRHHLEDQKLKQKEIK
jgi:hypothetical protein